MRVLIAPDSFGGTLSATEAAAAIADGWRAGRPNDELVLAPRSDGGPGFIDVLAGCGGHVHTARVRGPLGRETEAAWLLDEAGSGGLRTAYVESALACGLELLDRAPDRSTALAATSYGVGQLVQAVLDAGAQAIVVGLGGSSCTDGGAGLVQALGGIDAATAKLASVRLVAATDVEHPLLGPLGAAAVFGPQKGADPQAVSELEERLAHWAADLESATGRVVRDLPGAGAAGGIGAALLALGATRESGADVVAARTGQQALIAQSDLVLTGEGKFDHQSLRGKLVTALSSAARAAGVPVVVLAGQVLVDPGQAAAVGIAAAHSIADFSGSVQVAMTQAGPQLRALAEEVASRYG